MSNILKVSFCGKQKITSKALYQYDYGQILKFIDLNLPAAYEVHFSNHEHGKSTAVLATSNEVVIPDTYFVTGKDIYVWIYVHTGNDDGETEYQITIPVIKRAKPTNATPSSVQQDIIEQTLAALTGGVREAVGAANVALAAASSADLTYASAQECVLAAQSYALAAESAIAVIASIVSLPAVNSEDNGKILRVVDGKWAVVDFPNTHSGGNN